ncbi:MAG: hypothetical protein ACKOGK_07300, partial [Betaproteobacteria bacterium]
MPSDQASLGNALGELKASLNTDGPSPSLALSSDLPQPSPKSVERAELKRELLSLHARFETQQQSFLRRTAVQAQDSLSPVKLAVTDSQVGLVTDVHTKARSVELASVTDTPEGAIWSDRGELLSEPRLDAPSEPAISAEAPSALRPEYANLWERMRAGFALPPLDSPLVNKHIQYYSHKPEYLERMFERGSRYLFY